MARAVLAEQGDQLVAVVLGVGHQMPAAHVEPLHPVEALPEAKLHGLQRLAQVLGARFAQHVEVQSLDPLGQTAQLREPLGRDAQPRAGHAGIVQIGLDGRIERIDAQSARQPVDERTLAEPFVLREGVERDVVAACDDLVDVAVGVYRRIGVGRTAELLADEARFGGGTGRGPVGVFRQLGEDAPHGAGLQRHDDLRARRAAHAVDDRQIAVERRFVEQVTGRRYFGKIDHRHGSFRKNSHKINKNRRSATISAADFYGK